MTWRASDAIVDTSALLYLQLAGALDLFEALFTRVIVPGAVWDELRVGADAGIDVPNASSMPWAISLRRSQTVCRAIRSASEKRRGGCPNARSS
jgi:predicted nucleic acid-binding protein